MCVCKWPSAMYDKLRCNWPLAKCDSDTVIMMIFPNTNRIDTFFLAPTPLGSISLHFVTTNDTSIGWFFGVISVESYGRD